MNEYDYNLVSIFSFMTFCIGLVFWSIVGIWNLPRRRQ